MKDAEGLNIPAHCAVLTWVCHLARDLRIKNLSPSFTWRGIWSTRKQSPSPPPLPTLPPSTPSTPSLPPSLSLPHSLPPPPSLPPSLPPSRSRSLSLSLYLSIALPLSLSCSFSPLLISEGLERFRCRGWGINGLGVAVCIHDCGSLHCQ